MDKEIVLGMQKKGIMLHRLVYAVFLFSRLLFEIENNSPVLKINALLLGFVIVSEILEEFFVANNYFDKVILIRIFRYLQCEFIGILFIFIQGTQNPKIMVISMFIMYLAELLLTFDADKTKIIATFFLVAVPILGVSFLKINCLLDLLVFFMIFAAGAAEFLNYLKQIEKKIFAKQNELDKVLEKNENISNMQTILKNSNNQLNLQKFELEKANEQIKVANEEMFAQTEILRYIASAEEIPKISTQIVDTIMKTKHLGFCAVYIKENVYFNSQAHYVIRTDIAQLQSKLRESMESICYYLAASGEKVGFYYENLRENFPFLKDVYINSLYVKVLELNDEVYGLFMMGDNRRHLFDDNMSFYDVIIAQYDIAINNSKIYNKMEYMAKKDGLTGVNNRVYFTQLFDEVSKEITNSHGYMSVALLDIDKFKRVNDTYGHLAGDEVIKRIAIVTEKCIEKYDGFICRYGGEEFVVVLPNRKLEVAQPIIEELFEELCSQIVYYNDYEISMSVSVGLTSYPELCDSTNDLLRRADNAMYYSKEHGRHQIHVDDGEEKDN